ncbi:hypothetical protein ACJ73_03856 [Blastomyces percursus]|uniref:Uncharacterized protein n=1 Tax=Blastomyces percursus TaxID=1658174 RepID=A0A1J9Q7N0_9EURO|nr:hypothetical protein ACJ73_03856 [Blastomyces percursus]
MSALKVCSASNTARGIFFRVKPLLEKGKSVILVQGLTPINYAAKLLKRANPAASVGVDQAWIRPAREPKQQPPGPTRAGRADRPPGLCGAACRAGIPPNQVAFGNIRFCESRKSWYRYQRFVPGSGPFTCLGRSDKRSS